MKKFLYGVLAVVVAAVAVTVGGACYLIEFALRPDGTHEPEAEVMARVKRDNPQVAEWLDSLLAGNLLHDTTIVREDGVHLRALYAAAPQQTDHTAILVHGYTDRGAGMLMIGHLYNQGMGYNILLPDLAYHGGSEGRAIQMGWLDSHDVLRWAEVANSLFDCGRGTTRQVVHGISMGAATTMMLSGHELPEYIHCFVEDCGYTDVWSQFKKELKEDFGMPAFPLLHAASGICRLRFGWSFGKASALEQVARCTRPMMFIHGESDDYVPTSMVYPLYEAHTGVKELWVVPDAEHAVSYRDNPDEYLHRVGWFVANNI